MPRVGNKHYPYTPEGRAAAARDKRGRGLTATEGFNQPGQLDDAAGRAMYGPGGAVKAAVKAVKKVAGAVKKKKKKKKKYDDTLQLHQAIGLKKGGPVAGSKSSGRSKASTRADGIARQGHTKGRLV